MIYSSTKRESEWPLSIERHSPTSIRQTSFLLYLTSRLPVERACTIKENEGESLVDSEGRKYTQNVNNYFDNLC